MEEHTYASLCTKTSCIQRTLPFLRTQQTSQTCFRSERWLSCVPTADLHFLIILPEVTQHLVFQHVSVPQRGKERKRDWETEHLGSSPASGFYSPHLSAWTHPGHLFLDHFASICGKPTSSPPPPLSVLDPGQLGICFSSVPLGMWGWERAWCLQQNI